MERSTIFHGKIHYFYGYFPVRKLLVYQRVMFDATTIPNEPHMFDASIMCQTIFFSWFHQQKPRGPSHLGHLGHTKRLRSPWFGQELQLNAA